MATYTFNIRGENLPIKDLRSSDPYLVIRVPDQIKGDHLTAPGGIDSEAAEIGFELGEAAAEAGIAAVGILAVAGTAGAACAGAVAASVLAPVVISIAIPLAATQLYRVARKLHTSKEGYTEIYSSEPMKHNLNPTWPGFQLQFAESYHNSPHAKLLIEMWDWDRFSPSDFMGSCELYVKDIVHQTSEKHYQMLDKRGRPRAGMMHISARHDGAHAGAAVTHFADVAAQRDKLQREQSRRREEEEEERRRQQQHQQHEYRPTAYDHQQAHSNQYPQQYTQQYTHNADSYYGQHQQYAQSYDSNYYPPPADPSNTYNQSYYNNNNNSYNNNNHYSNDNAYQSCGYKNEHPYVNYDGQSNHQYSQHSAPTSAQYSYGYPSQ